MPKAEPKIKAPKKVLPPLVVERLPEFAGEDGLQIVSYSELDTYRQCPLKHMLSYKERWKKPPKLGSPLARGSLWHLVMEVHYGTIMEHYQGIKRMVPKNKVQEVLDLAKSRVLTYLADEVTGLQDADQVLIQWMYEGYVEKWGIDEEWEILAIEYSFIVPLPDADGNDSAYALKGKIDILARNRNTGLVWIWDHKSGKDLPTQMALEIDDQFGGYTWAMSKLGYTVGGSLHNGARTQQNQGDLATDEELAKNKSLKRQTLDQRMKRSFLNRSQEECDNLAYDAYAASMNAYPPPERQLPLYSSPDIRQCGWKCDFKEVHLIARGGRDIHRVLLEFGFVQDFTRH